jgi:SOS-response transcriptional repressor LexA
VYADWIKKGLRKPGKTAVGLAQAITKALKLKKPMPRQTVYKMTWGARTVYSEELAPIAAYIEEPIPNIPTHIPTHITDVVSISVQCEIGAGIWIEPGVSEPATNIGTILAPKDHVFPHSKLLAYAFKGDSMLSVGILDGDVLICIPSRDDEIEDGRQVVIERNRAGLIERSARIVMKHSDRTEYVVASPHDAKYKPCIVHKKGKRPHGSENETVKVVAIIRRVTRNIP